MNTNNRMLIVVVAIVVAVALLLDPNVSLRFVGTLQSLVIIILGITATLYLWKRM